MLLLDYLRRMQNSIVLPSLKVYNKGLLKWTELSSCPVKEIHPIEGHHFKSLD